MDLKALKWYRRGRVRYAFCKVTGLGMTDHPAMLSQRDGAGNTLTVNLGVPPIDLRVVASAANQPADPVSVTLELNGEQFTGVAPAEITVKP